MMAGEKVARRLYVDYAKLMRALGEPCLGYKQYVKTVSIMVTGSLDRERLAEFYEYYVEGCRSRGSKPCSAAFVALGWVFHAQEAQRIRSSMN